ncbi:UPAR/Ly6 domain-containing protein bou-like [Ornithodoros turicata]|uniref:UPAR/Ly6 domain-containing protein bou-like n=1 Tax=Ornithodoros turicata TaxID=34597 RepID=UPI003139A445
MTLQIFGSTALGVTAFLCLFTSGATIKCYECDSNDQLHCSERWDMGLIGDVEPQNCSYLHEARYCIKATGMYKGRIGTFRFCSARDWGHYCDYTSRPGDEREYRACMYTCYTDGCNSAPYSAVASTFLLMLSVLLSLALVKGCDWH